MLFFVIAPSEARVQKLGVACQQLLHGALPRNLGAHGNSAPHPTHNAARRWPCGWFSANGSVCSPAGLVCRRRKKLFEEKKTDPRGNCRAVTAGGRTFDGCALPLAPRHQRSRLRAARGMLHAGASGFALGAAGQTTRGALVLGRAGAWSWAVFFVVRRALLRAARRKGGLVTCVRAAALLTRVPCRAAPHVSCALSSPPLAFSTSSPTQPLTSNRSSPKCWLRRTSSARATHICACTRCPDMDDRTMENSAPGRFAHVPRVGYCNALI